MTNEEILALVKQAGLSHFYDSEGDCSGVTDAPLTTADKDRNDARLLEILAPLVRLVEERTVKQLNAESK